MSPFVGLLKTSLAVTYTLTHSVTINVRGSKEVEAAKKEKITSSSIKFEISD